MSPQLMVGASLALIVVYTICGLDPIESYQPNWTGSKVSSCPTCCESPCSALDDPIWHIYAKSMILDSYATFSSLLQGTH